MNLSLRRLLLAIVMLSLGACVAYDPYYYPYAAQPAQPSLQQRFERSWSAAAGAMADQGLTITSQDRGAGVMRGEKAGAAVTATVTTRADDRIQVEIASVGSSSTDPTLAQRVHESYERRMGR